MGLFSTLATTSLAAGATEASDQPETEITAESSSSCLTLPTILQLYAVQSTQPLCLQEDKKTQAFSLANYQAVSLAEGGAAAPTEEVGLRVKKKDTSADTKPELGVWNCGVAPPRTLMTGTSESSKTTREEASPVLPLLSRIVQSAAPVWCFTVDLSQPDTVEPSLTLLQQTLVRHLIETSSTPDLSTATATTTLHQLKTVQFGRAAQEETPAAAVPPEAKDKSIAVTLHLAVQMPNANKSSKDEYEQQQVQALLLYHLRKYAAALNASLCFVDKVGDASAEASDKEGSNVQQQPVLTVSELKQVWRNLALGQAVWNEDEQEADVVAPSPSDEDGGAAADATAPSTKVYGPGTHQTDLIETVLLRHANYPGHWNAEKDSIWKILPAPTVSLTGQKSTASKSGKSSKVGDEGWLTELHESVASISGPAATPPRQKTPPRGSKQTPTTSKTTPAQTTPNEAADYFASFLKK